MGLELAVFGFLDGLAVEVDRVIFGKKTAGLGVPDFVELSGFHCYLFTSLDSLNFVTVSDFKHLPSSNYNPLLLTCSFLAQNEHRCILL